MLWFMVDAADAFMRAAGAVGVLTAPGQIYKQDEQSLAVNVENCFWGCVPFYEELGR